VVEVFFESVPVPLDVLVEALVLSDVDAESPLDVDALADDPLEAEEPEPAEVLLDVDELPESPPDADLPLEAELEALNELGALEEALLDPEALFPGSSGTTRAIFE